MRFGSRAGVADPRGHEVGARWLTRSLGDRLCRDKRTSKGGRSRSRSFKCGGHPTRCSRRAFSHWHGSCLRNPRAIAKKSRAGVADLRGHEVGARRLHRSLGDLFAHTKGAGFSTLHQRVRMTVPGKNVRAMSNAGQQNLVLSHSRAFWSQLRSPNKG
jgi:hypothetical protein